MARLIRPSLSWPIVAVILAGFRLAPHLEAAAPTKVYVFNGRIQSVNAAARTFTLSGAGKGYTFHVTADTKITWSRGPLAFSTLKAGQEANVEMKIGPDGKGIALSVKLASPWTPRFAGSGSALSGPMAESLLAGTTPGGKRLTAAEIRPLIISSPWPRSVHSVIGYLRIKPGVFLLSVRSDGTVEKVETLQSIGHKGADGDSIKAFSKWRFRPNSVKEVRVPAQYSFNGFNR